MTTVQNITRRMQLPYLSAMSVAKRPFSTFLGATRIVRGAAVAAALIGMFSASPGKAQYVSTSPSEDQTVNQPSGTTLMVNSLRVPLIRLGTGSNTAVRNTDDQGWGSLNVGPSVMKDSGGNTSARFLFGGYGSNLMVSADDGSIGLDGWNGPIYARITPAGDFHITEWSGQQSTSPTVFCVKSSDNDFVGVGGDNACGCYDIFDVSKRDVFGNRYMHWYAHAAAVSWNIDGTAVASGWKCRNLESVNWRSELRHTTDGNGLGTISVGRINFADGSHLTGASGSTSTASPSFTGNVGIGTLRRCTDSASRIVSRSATTNKCGA